MRQEIEIEFKNLLTESEFVTLTKAFSILPENFVKQENHYFDTTTFSLKEKGSALRIRFKEGTYTLTLKQPIEHGLLETHQDITEDEAIMMFSSGGLPEGDIYNIIQALNINPMDLTYLGCLKTLRAETSYLEGTLVFDHSYYLGVEDYELEYEATEFHLGQQNFNDLLEIHKITKRHTENKIKRFFMAKHLQQQKEQ
jgi:uncharacterized protein YjbK